MKQKLEIELEYLELIARKMNILEERAELKNELENLELWESHEEELLKMELKTLSEKLTQVKNKLEENIKLRISLGWYNTTFEEKELSKEELERQFRIMFSKLRKLEGKKDRTFKLMQKENLSNSEYNNYSLEYTQVCDSITHLEAQIKKNVELRKSLGYLVVEL